MFIALFGASDLSGTSRYMIPFFITNRTLAGGSNVFDRIAWQGNDISEFTGSEHAEIITG